MRGRTARLRDCAATRAPVRAGEEFHEARIVARVGGCQSNITPTLHEYCGEIPKPGEASDTDALQFSTLAQPGFSSVFLLSYFLRTLENSFTDLEIIAIERQRLSKF